MALFTRIYCYQAGKPQCYETRNVANVTSSSRMWLYFEIIKMQMRIKLKTDFMIAFKILSSS